jgi:hypothetical protein
VSRIERFTSRADADLARSVLEANGIPAYVSGDDAGGLHPEIPYGIGGTAVVVPDERYDEAIVLLDDHVGGGPVEEAELEAAAMAAGSAEVGGATRVQHWGELASTGPDARPSTRRSGRRRPLFVIVLGLMLVALVVMALLTAFLQLFVW